MAESSRLDELRRRVQQDPASIAFAALAEEYRRARRFRDAVDTSRAGLRHHPNYISARVTLGRSLIEIGDYEPAERELVVVLRNAPDNLAARRAMGELCWQQLRFADALYHYRTALTLVPRDTELPGIVDALEKEIEAEEAAQAAEQSAVSVAPADEAVEPVDEAVELVSAESQPDELVSVEMAATQPDSADLEPAVSEPAEPEPAEVSALDMAPIEAPVVAFVDVPEEASAFEPAAVGAAPELESLEESVEFAIAHDPSGHLADDLSADVVDHFEPQFSEPEAVALPDDVPMSEAALSDRAVELSAELPVELSVELAVEPPEPPAPQVLQTPESLEIARCLLVLERLHAGLRHEQARREEERVPLRARSA